MPARATVTKAAASATNQRWKGKKKQTYQDDPGETEGLLGDDEARDSEEEVGRAGPARLPTHEVRSAPDVTQLGLKPSSDRLHGRAARGMWAARRISPELFRSDHQVCSGKHPVRPQSLNHVYFFLSDKLQARFAPNTVKNQKYNTFTFLPIVFYEQFKFFFNLYFLLVALSQFVPALKIGLDPLPCFPS